MANERVQLIIEAKDLATEAIKKLRASMEDFSGTTEKVKGSTSKLKSTFESLQKHWLAFAGVIAATAWLRSAIIDALEAEEAFNKLKIQVEGLGIVYSSVSKKIEEQINITSKYAIVQKEEVARTLQELIFYSGDVDKSMQNLNLTYDLAYQKVISTSEAASLIGKAMTGNVEMIGRYIPELRNLDKKLGENATEAEKAAYAFAILEEKSADALAKMTENEKKLKESAKVWKDFKQAIGEVSLKVVVGGIKEIGAPLETNKTKIDEFVTSLKNIWNAIRYGADEAERMAKETAEMGKEMDKTADSSGKSAEEIKKEAKARSDAIEEIKKSISMREQEAQALKIVMDFEAEIEERSYQYGETSLRKYLNKRLQMVEDYTSELISIREKQIEAIKSLPEEMQDPAKIRAIEDEIKQIRINAAKEIISIQGKVRDSITQNLKEAEDRHKQYAAKIIELENKIANNKERSVDKIRSLDRKLMSSADAYRDATAEAEEFGKKAREALSEGDIAKAERYAQKMEQAYASLPEEIKDASGKMVISQQEGLEVIKAGIQGAIDLQDEIYEAQKQKVEETKAAEVTRIEELKSLAQGLNAEFEKITDPKMINIDTTEAMAKIDALLQKLAQIEIPGTSAMQSEELAGFQRGGFFSGYGGGDKIPALVEAGEFIHRKEAVQYYGTSLMHALNRMLLPKKFIEIIRGLQSRIPTMPEFNIPLRMQEGGEVPNLGHYTVDLNFGGNKVSMRADGFNTQKLLKILRREMKTG